MHNSAHVWFVTNLHRFHYVPRLVKHPKFFKFFVPPCVFTARNECVPLEFRSHVWGYMTKIKEVKSQCSADLGTQTLWQTDRWPIENKQNAMSVTQDNLSIFRITVDKICWQYHRFLCQTCLYIAGASTVSSETFFRFTFLSCYSNTWHQTAQQDTHT